uniref:Uncharacterized protein n=1 Tax=Megaselia scalaris TaxID=36166 RepID=T1GHD4_MEGSC
MGKDWSQIYQQTDPLIQRVTYNVWIVYSSHFYGHEIDRKYELPLLWTGSGENQPKWGIRYNQELYQLHNIQALFGNFELDACNVLDMCRGWKKMSQQNMFLYKRDGVSPYHLMLEQLAFPTDEQQQKNMKYDGSWIVNCGSVSEDRWEAEFGVGFAVRGKARYCVTRWTPIV